MNVETVSKIFETNILPALLRLVGAIIIFYVGRWAIHVGVRLISKAMTHNKIDATLVRYLTSIISGLLMVFLCLGLAGFMGIETTGFAALAAGAGLAIGAAWSGMLGNFAAGVFMIVMQPFKVGDEINAGGVIGKVKEIGLFATTVDTEEKVHTIIGNSKLFDDKISNFTSNPTRVCALDFGVVTGTAFRPRMEPLTKALEQIPGVKPGSAEVRFKTISGGPVLEAAVECPHADWERVRGEMADQIDRAIGDLGYTAYSPVGGLGEGGGEGGAGGEAAEAGGEEGGEGE